MAKKEYTVVDHNREGYKQRNNFTDSDYFKIVSLSMKFYRQGVEYGKDIAGNDLTEEEIKICEILIEKMKREMAITKEAFEKKEDEREECEESKQK
ncbi:hypothetical protein [Priestia megaterium]|uniref:hypothetical protein n=1 Tax=Priestia megaterium TaxID=1404 RepID=UPI0028543CB2|nr:hypothetical protein [Priestia megaterium]MDR7207650.1 hypothetical protein [Priestia megaterium]